VLSSRWSRFPANPDVTGADFGDNNTEPAHVRGPATDCTGSGPNPVRKLARAAGYDRRMLRRFLLAVAAAVLAGCGTSSEDLPAACTEGADAVRAALRDAPGRVRVDGTRLSRCLRGSPDGDQVQIVGTAFVESASGLSREARHDPEGRGALELGYLVAAAHRGGSNQGVHSELLRRLDQELLTIDTRSRAFRRGRRAGQTGG
jgi:hypothetical protein